MHIPWISLRTYSPMLLAWMVLVGWLAYLLYSRSQIARLNDEASIREWLDETRPFRKTLPELLKEYVDKLDSPNDDHLVSRESKELEIRVQLQAMTEATQTYANLLPLYPEVERIEIAFPANPDVPPIVWLALSQHAQIQQKTLRTLVFSPVPDRATLSCRYHLHAFNRGQREEREQQTIIRVIAAVVIFGSLFALLGATTILRREREREVAKLRAESALEHKENEVLGEKLRAEEAEKTALEMKSQLFAGIGIMAGSYAHNIKNLLVRPNDLIARCLEVQGLPGDQATMLREVRGTLGTVTERLQEILKTVRRDPTQTQMGQIDLNELLRQTVETWGLICQEKWKLILTAELSSDELQIAGDLSHLQQAIENLLFNARDATFEMRNQIRDAARAADAGSRKQALIDAAGWRGQVTLRSFCEGEAIVLEVRDNGIGMTDEVRQRCFETHFTTKRNNALYEGYNAGMGLGLSFVMAVLEHHGASIEIESQPHKGATFRIRFL